MGALVGGAVVVVVDGVEATAAVGAVKVQELDCVQGGTAVLAFGERALAVRKKGWEESAAVVTALFRIFDF